MSATGCDDEPNEPASPETWTSPPSPTTHMPLPLGVTAMATPVGVVALAGAAGNPSRTTATAEAAASSRARLLPDMVGGAPCTGTAHMAERGTAAGLGGRRRGPYPGRNAT